MCNRDDHIPISALPHWPPNARVVRVLRTKDQWGRKHRATLLAWTEGPDTDVPGDERLAYFSIEDDTPGEYLGDTFPCEECENTGSIKGIGNRDVPCRRCG